MHCVDLSVEVLASQTVAQWHDLNLEIMYRLLAIAEETLTEFLAKATGTAVDWIQLPGMKVCQDADRTFFGLNCALSLNVEYEHCNFCS